MDYRTLTIDLDEELRVCEHCDKSLSDKNDTILIVVPKADMVFEYCSWFCLVKHTKEMLKNKLLDFKLAAQNMLRSLKYDDNEKRINSRLSNTEKDKDA